MCGHHGRDVLALHEHPQVLVLQVVHEFHGRRLGALGIGREREFHLVVPRDLALHRDGLPEKQLRLVILLQIGEASPEVAQARRDVGVGSLVQLAKHRHRIPKMRFRRGVAALADQPGAEVVQGPRHILFALGQEPASDGERATIEVRRLVRGSGLPAITVNPSLPAGPRDIKPTPTGRMIINAATGRMPAYVDTGLNVVHVDDVAEGHLLVFSKGKVGERYILGGHNMTLGEILIGIAAEVGRKPPRVKLPHGVVLPIAYVSEIWARLTGGEPFATVDGVRMAKKKMFFSSAKAESELGYRARPAVEALRDALAWFRANGYLP